MQKRRLGTSGPETSALGIGAMSFGPFYGPTTVEDSFGVLDAAMELGVSHIDTSNVYDGGGCETVIGQYLAARPEARDHFVIATKAGITRDADGKRCYRNDLAHLEAELDGSLRRMGVDSVALFYIHRRQAEMPIEEATEALAALVRKGKARSIGFSEIAPASLRRAAAVHPVAAVQSEYSLSTRAPELGLVQTCAELGSALVAFSPVGRGLLSDTPPSLEKAAGIGFLKGNPRFQPDTLPANLAATDRMRALAAEMGEPTAALAMAWLLSRGDHVLPIPGTRTADHFRELMRGAELRLSETDIAAIETALPVGWCHGDRYNSDQWIGPERFC